MISMLKNFVFKRPDGYNYPFFTSKMVAEILGVTINTILKRCKDYATEVLPNQYLWTEENIDEMIRNDGKKKSSK